MILKKKIISIMLIVLCVFLSSYWTIPIYADSIIMEGTLDGGFTWVLTDIGEEAFETAELLTEDKKISKEFIITEELIYRLIVVVFIVFVVAYIIGIFRGGYSIGEPLSKEYRKDYRFNRIVYCIFCASMICVILCVEMDIKGLPFESAWLDKAFNIAVNYIIPWTLVIGGILWFLTELIRDDFPWGMARVGARGLKFIVLIVVTILLAELIKKYTGVFIFIGYLVFAVMCFLIAWLLMLVAVAIPVFLDYIVSQIFRRDINFFTKVFVIFPVGVMDFTTDLLDSLPKTYEDVRFLKSDDDVRVIEVDGELRKLRRENPGSDVFVEVKDPTKRYEEN